jgi:NAD(P)H-flavin reductase/hemoglobin-like flavoprotein
MTVNPVVSQPPLQRAEQPAAVALMVRLVRESFAVVEPHAEQVAEAFYANLFSLAPETRDMFPLNMQVQRTRFMRVLVRIVQMLEQPEELVPFLRQMGRDHRKFGVVSKQYESLGMALLAAVKRFAGDAWTVEVEHAWAEFYTIMARAMLDAAANDTGPAWWSASVVEHERRARDLAIVRLLPDHPMPYQAGQYVSVEIPQRPRLWRYLTPANAPREDGMLEFHVRAVAGGWVSRSIVAESQPGDVWRLGPAMGQLRVDRGSGRDVTMVAGGTGLAPMRAIVEELSQWGQNPRVHLFYGGRVQTDLYDLSYLQSIAATNPWLTVVPVLETDAEAGNAEPGTLADVITRYGSWPDRDVLVAGSPAMIRSTVSRMLVAGTPLDHIAYDPFTLD